ncbi:hypothetical protein S83_001047 [Arachis hypogaea]
MLQFSSPCFGISGIQSVCNRERRVPLLVLQLLRKFPSVVCNCYLSAKVTNTNQSNSLSTNKTSQYMIQVSTNGGIVTLTRSQDYRAQLYRLNRAASSPQLQIVTC